MAAKTAGSKRRRCASKFTAARRKGTVASKNIAAKQLSYYENHGWKVHISLPILHFMRDNTEDNPMCDYSLMHLASRPAAVGDKLVTANFGTGTRGFASPDDANTAVCVLPGTELVFDKNIDVLGRTGPAPHKTARFRQINIEQACMHHDAIELPDGECILLTYLAEGQRATVLQLPAAPKTEAEAQEQKRLEVVA